MKLCELKILIGISASGKSTWAKDFVTKNDKWCIVSRDDFRYAWQNKGVVDTKLETIITKMVKSSIDTLINNGYNVIYDATNLKSKYIDAIASIVKHTATVTYQIFDIPLETAIERDSKRERSVGKDVIKKQWKDYLQLLDSFDFKDAPPVVKWYIAPVHDEKKNDAIIVDIDGTLAHTSGKRSPYDYTKVQLDDCDVSVKTIVNRLGAFYKVLIVSGREDNCKNETRNWLAHNGITCNQLIMRKTGDQRKDSIIKEEIFWEYIEPKYNVIAVIDDRDQVVEMWRNLGLKTLQCEYGNF